MARLPGSQIPPTLSTGVKSIDAAPHARVPMRPSRATRLERRWSWSAALVIGAAAIAPDFPPRWVDEFYLEGVRPTYGR